VVHRHRLAGPHDTHVDRELPEAGLALEVDDRRATLGVAPDHIARVHDEPAVAARHEPVLRAFEARLGDHRRGRIESPRMADPYDAFPSLELDRPAPHVLRITLRKAGRLNAVDADAHRELAYVWNTIATDDETRVALVRGADGAFSAGGDLDLVLDIASSYETRLRVFHEARDLVYNIVNCPKPVVAAVTGPAVGAGLAVALLADISIATPNARIVDGHTRLGVAAGDHSVIVWPLLCGLAKAKYHLLLCEPVDGVEAERLGLVSLCVPEEELEARALEIAERLAAGSQPAIRHTKLALNNWLRAAGPAFDASLALEFLDMSGPDVPEGVAAIRERRKPDFA
jgi:enoyl-CoA hydratase